MPSFSNVEDALKYANKLLKKKADDVLFNEVADKVRNIEQEHIYSDVYSRPESNKYKRRYSNGGFGDINNIVKRKDDDAVTISNDTEFNPYLNGRNGSGGISANASRANGLDGLINYGNGWNGIYYDWSDESFTLYFENTLCELNNSKAHIDTMKNGLKRLGLDVR